MGAKNQFSVITICDLGPPENGSIELGRMVQATPDRFNCFSPVWGYASQDLLPSNLNPTETSGDANDAARALFFLSDRDVKLTGATSPWGTRAPSPSFDGSSCVHVLPLPLPPKKDALDQHSIDDFLQAPYGGGATEVAIEEVREMKLLLDALQNQSSVDALPGNDGKQINATEQTVDGTDNSTVFTDAPISFGDEQDESFSFARSSYRIDKIPAGDFIEIVCQLADDPSLLLLTKKNPKEMSLNLFAISGESKDVALKSMSELTYLESVEMSSDGHYIITVQDEKIKITPKTAEGAVAFFEDFAPVKNNVALN